MVTGEAACEVEAIDTGVPPCDLERDLRSFSSLDSLDSFSLGLRRPIMGLITEEANDEIPRKECRFVILFSIGDVVLEVSTVAFVVAKEETGVLHVGVVLLLSANSSLTLSDRPK